MNKSIVVFCGSSPGRNERITQEAIALANLLSSKNIRLIYGGAKVGLMGRLADEMLESGGEVVGIIPTFLKTTEIVHEGLTELIEVKDMQERKWKMHELSDLSITLPGGFGTIDELFEFLTWKQLNIINKPIGVLNVDGFYDSLADLIQIQLQSGFIRKEHLNLLTINNDVEKLLNTLLKKLE